MQEKCFLYDFFMARFFIKAVSEHTLLRSDMSWMFGNKFGPGSVLKNSRVVN